MARKALRTKRRNPRDETATIASRARKRGDAILGARIALLGARLRAYGARLRALEARVR